MISLVIRSPQILQDEVSLPGLPQPASFDEWLEPRDGQWMGTSSEIYGILWVLWS